MIVARATVQESLGISPSDQDDNFERIFSKSENSVVEEAQRIANLLGIEDRYERFWKSNAGADLARSKDILTAVRPDLDRCSAAIRDHYLSRQKATSAVS
jgi:hypothetical protein